MTKQDLIENNIFLPEVIDSQIKARFLLGDWILLSTSLGILILLKMINNSTFKTESDVLNFKLLKPQEWSMLKRKEYNIKRTNRSRQIWYRNSPIASMTWYLHPDDIDKVIKGLSYD